MASRRYTILVADRSSGVVRRLTISLRPLMVGACFVVALPILIGLGAAWKAKSDVAGLRSSHATLELENANYRSATDALSSQITSLHAAISDLGQQSTLDPNLARAMDRLPPMVKSRALGGSTPGMQSAQNALSSMANLEDTFGLLRTLLAGIESGLQVVRKSVDRRNALAEATPSIWPAHGWLSSTVGYRRDPVTGGADFHTGLDIAGDRGEPVYATAAGKVSFAGRSGNYGNFVIIDHGFGLQTRYGHLLKFTVKPGDPVKRGAQIGQVGATGRATGYHLHYEVMANGKLLNPLQLLTQRPNR
jgi:murein DD-endopeptidase MepM/ murein hydrolase activator NlpD